MIMTLPFIPPTQTRRLCDVIIQWCAQHVLKAKILGWHVQLLQLFLPLSFCQASRQHADLHHAMTSGLYKLGFRSCHTDVHHCRLSHNLRFFRDEPVLLRHQVEHGVRHLAEGQ